MPMPAQPPPVTNTANGPTYHMNSTQLSEDDQLK